MRQNLVDRCLLWLLAKRRNNLESKGFECVDCPLCNSADENVAGSLRPALYLGRIVLPVVDHVAPIKDAVDKEVSV